MVEITTNNHERELISWNDLTEKEQKEFDYLSWDDHDNPQFFRYKGNTYDLGGFTTTAGLDNKLDSWDGYSNDTYFSGIVVKYAEDDHIKVGRYYVGD